MSDKASRDTFRRSTHEACTPAIIGDKLRSGEITCFEAVRILAFLGNQEAQLYLQEVEEPVPEMSVLDFKNPNIYSQWWRELEDQFELTKDDSFYRQFRLRMAQALLNRFLELDDILSIQESLRECFQQIRSAIREALHENDPDSSLRSEFDALTLEHRSSSSREDHYRRLYISSLNLALRNGRGSIWSVREQSSQLNCLCRPETLESSHRRTFEVLYRELIPWLLGTETSGE